MLKAGTAMQMLDLQDRLPKEVYLYALRLTTILDGHYGENRDVENDDGGVILFVEAIEDVDRIGRDYVRLDSGNHEAVHFVSCKGGDYADVLYLTNNDFGINVLIPLSLLPEQLLNEMISNRKDEK